MLHDSSNPSIVRRTFVSGALAGGVMLSGAGAWAGEAHHHASGACTHGLIDVHHHPTIKSYTDLYEGALGPMAGWSVEKSLADMDRAGTATSLLSLPPPVNFWAGAKDKVVAQVREWNDYMAGVARDHPGRFGVFAALPVPYSDASLAEIEYVFDTLKVAGVGITTNIGDKWLGDPIYSSLFEALDRRKAIVFVHPVAANCCQGLLPGISDPTVEFPTDTTRAIVRLLFSGAAAKFPNIKFIFCHAGGTMPYTVERLLILPRFTPGATEAVPDGVLPTLQRFYYDTAFSANPYAMGALKKLVPMSQILFGSDFPFGNALATLSGLKDSGIFSENELCAIGRQNMLGLGPQLG